MTDEDILKRLAEIEGIELSPFDGLPQVGGDPIWRLWNPLTSNADAFALIEKYDVQIATDEEGERMVLIRRRYGHFPCSTDPDLKRAICLAVIEANA